MKGARKALTCSAAASPCTHKHTHTPILVNAVTRGDGSSSISAAGQDYYGQGGCGGNDSSPTAALHGKSYEQRSQARNNNSKSKMPRGGYPAPPAVPFPQAPGVVTRERKKMTRLVQLHIQAAGVRGVSFPIFGHVRCTQENAHKDGATPVCSRKVCVYVCTCVCERARSQGYRRRRGRGMSLLTRR